MAIEKKDLEIPIEFQKKMNDIMLDNPTLVYLGDSKFKVHKLRMYSQQRILKVGLRLLERDSITDINDNRLMMLLATDIESTAEIVAIILCNHLFDAEQVNSFEAMNQLLDRNEKLIHFMTNKVLMNTTMENQWAAIIMEAFNSTQIEDLFTLSSLAKIYTSSATMRRKKAAEQFQLWQAAQSENLETS